MKNKILLTIITGMFLLAFVGVVEADLGSYKQNSDVLLKAEINAVSVNLTIYYPNSSIVIQNQSMTNVMGDIWSHDFENTSVMGVYVYDYCDENGTNCIQNFFTITADGNPVQNFPTQFNFIILAMFLIFVSYFNERLNLFRYLGAILIMVVGVITIYPGYSFINHTNLNGLGLGSVLIALGFYFLVEDSFSKKRQSKRFDQDHNEAGNQDEEQKFFEQEDED